jgi:hypothetical protein
VSLDFVEVGQEVFALLAVDLVGGLGDPVEHLVEGGQHGGEVGVETHGVGLAPVSVRRVSGRLGTVTAC